MKNILKWNRLNSLKVNPEKFQFMILGDKTCYSQVSNRRHPRLLIFRKFSTLGYSYSTKPVY